MSLLLDALKKAAQDKIARSDSGVLSDSPTQAQNGRDASLVVSEKADPEEETLNAFSEPAKPGEDSVSIDSAMEAESREEEFEFTLDDQHEEAGPEAVAETGPDQASIPDSNFASIAAENRTVGKSANISAMHTTVTDEALQLLIHKTNVDHRKRQYLIWSGVITGSLLILILAGLYFYIGMEDEIETMRLKNRKALAALVAQTKIEENLTSLATPVMHPVVKNTQHKTGNEARVMTARPPAQQAPVTKQSFTIQKTEKQDPINVLLSRGWSSFQQGEYDTAAKAYNAVLQREARNRDALLGIAAVAGKRGENEKAREYYLNLLELDPLDPHAHAGLAYIAQSEGASLSENRLKQLIEKQPDGAHLQFVLGNLYAQQNKWPQAQQAYFSAWQSDSANADYAFNLAVSLDHLKKYTEAERFYRSSIDLSRDRKTGFSVDAVEKRLHQLRGVKQ